jgi:cytochrome c
MDIRDTLKIPAAVLVSGIAFFIAGLVGDLVVRVSSPKNLAIRIEAPPPPPPVVAGPAAPVPSIAARLAKADVAAGEAFAAKGICAVCHSFNEGGKAVIGPNLYNVVGGPHAHMAGFAYSDGLKSLPGNWTYENLDAWLTKPAAVVPGTKMAFPGIADPQTRANVIAWLRTLSPDPVPLPEAKETAAAPAAAATGGGLPPVEPLLANADPKAGEAFAKTICLICHTVTEGGAAIIGPNLYNVVGGPHAHMAGYAYSTAMKSKTGPWTYAELNRWLYKPGEYAPGTKMAFPGIPDAQLRANVIAWLRSLSPDPVPLP